MKFCERNIKLHLKYLFNLPKQFLNSVSSYILQTLDNCLNIGISFLVTVTLDTYTYSYSYPAKQARITYDNFNL